MKQLVDKLRREREHMQGLMDDATDDDQLTDSQRPDILDALEVVIFSLTDAIKVCDDSE